MDSSKINYYFPTIPKRHLENSPLESTLAKRLREESQALKKSDLENGSHTKETDHTECMKKINALEEQIVELTKKNQLLTKDCKRLKKLFDDAAKMNLHKDIKMKDILSAQSNSIEQPLMFASFKDLSGPELTALRSIPSLQTADSKFVTKCLRIAYRNDIHLLAQRTAKNETEGKQPISPEKKDFIRKMYEERLLYIPTEQYSTRSKNLNEHLKNGIRNTVSMLKKD